jgi:hypothetical protein
VSWFKVTNTSGAAVYLNTDNCLRVRANAGEHGTHPKSVIDLIRGEQATMETPEEVIEAISQAAQSSRKASPAETFQGNPLVQAAGQARLSGPSSP